MAIAPSLGHRVRAVATPGVAATSTRRTASSGRPGRAPVAFDGVQGVVRARGPDTGTGRGRRYEAAW